jgi:hypothetical protein
MSYAGALAFLLPQQQPLDFGEAAAPFITKPYPAASTAVLNCPGEASFSSYCTVASPGVKDTLTSVTPMTAFKACVTLLVQPPQRMPVTFNITVCTTTPHKILVLDTAKVAQSDTAT